MRIYVISLTRSDARRKQIRDQLERLGCAYELFSAIDGADGRNYFDRLDEKRYLLNTGRVPSDGEIGCFASHLYLWNVCVALGEPIVILEDDAELDSLFKDALEAAARWIGDCGFIRLQTEGPGRKPRLSPVAATGRFTLDYCRHYPYGAMGYAVAPATAQAFVRTSRVLAAPADGFIRQSWKHGRPLFALSPPVVWGGEPRHASTIAGRDRAPLRPALRVQRALTKIHLSVSRALFNLRYRPRHDKAR